MPTCESHRASGARLRFHGCQDESRCWPPLAPGGAKPYSTCHGNVYPDGQQPLSSVFGGFMRCGAHDSAESIDDVPPGISLVGLNPQTRPTLYRSQPDQPETVEVKLGSSGSTVVLMTSEDGDYTLNGVPFSGGGVVAENGAAYMLEFKDGKWVATWIPTNFFRLQISEAGWCRVRPRVRPESECALETTIGRLEAMKS